MNPLFLNPWLIGGAAVVLILVGAMGYGKGYTSGVDSLADDLTTCNTTLNTIKGEQHALAEENAAIQRRSDRLVKDVSVAWDAALHAGHRPVSYRVRDRDCSGAGTVQVPGAPGQPDAATAKPEVDQAGTVALTVAEINERLNTYEHDAAQLAHLIRFIEQQKAIHK